MKIYTVHVPAGTDNAQEKAIFLPEGFNLYAFFFHFFWALYHRLWTVAALIFVVLSVLMMAAQMEMISSVTRDVLHLGFLVLIGYHANDWLRAGLGKRHYVMADVSVADSLLHAQQRYFERSVCRSS